MGDGKTLGGYGEYAYPALAARWKMQEEESFEYVADEE